MATVSVAPRARREQAPAVPVRHGTCGLHLTIGGTRYRLRPITPPAGIKAIWTLRKAEAGADRPATYQVSVPRGLPASCTCPDFAINGAVCKHLGALRALGLIPGRKPRPAAARRSHARSLDHAARAEGGAR